MTLIEKCNDLAKLLDSNKRMVGDREKAKSLEERRRELVEMHGGLSGQVEIARVYLEGGVLVRTKLPPLARLKDKVQPVLENFRGESSSITKGKAYKDLIKQAEGLADKFDKVLADAWEQFFKRQVPVVDKELLATYQESGQFQDKVINISMLVESLNKSKGKPPAKKNELDDFLAQSKTLRDEYTDLQVTNLPEDVLVFFRAANSLKGASLSLLTLSVANWLREHDKFDAFRIRP